MAYANNFVVKNGLTVGTTQIANSQGHWTGQQISFVSVPLSGADATQNNQIQAAFNQANVTVGIDATQNLAITYANTTVNTIIGIDATQNLAIAYANTTVNTIIGIDATQNLAIAYANTTVNTIIGIDATQNLAIASAYTRANNSLNANTGGTVTGDVTITGNLIVSGVTTTVNTSTINVTDSLIKLANNNVVGDTLDIGFYGQSNNSTNVVYHGLVRRAGADFFLFKNLTSDPTSNVLATGSLTATNTATLRANLNGGMISGLANSIGILDGGTGSSTFNNNQLVFYSGATSNIVSLANAIIATTSSSNGTFVPVITVDPFGRVTSVSNTAIDTTYVSSAYFQANTANILAQAAFNQANSANILAQAAFNQANVTVGVDATQNASITIIQGVDNTQNNRITINEAVDLTQNNQIQAAFNQANSASSTANTDYTTLVITTTTSSSNGTYIPVIQVAANGRVLSVTNTAVTFGGSINTGTGVSTGDASIELGVNRSDNGVSYIDFHSTYPIADFDLRLLRAANINGNAQLLNTGTGEFQIGQLHAGPLVFLANSTESMRIAPTGAIGLSGANYGTSGQVLTSQGSSSPPIWSQGMTYPGSGIVNSTGSAWGTSYSTTGSGTVVALATSPSLTTPILGTPQSGNFSTGTFTWPTFNQNTSGSAASLSISGQTGLLTFTGLTATSRIKTVRDAADTILELGGNYTPTGTWNWTSATATWPTFNQNTSGSAATFTSTTQNSQFNSIGVGTAGSGTAGEIRATNNITAYYSDKRLKKNIRTIQNALEKLNKISGVYYEQNEIAKKYGYYDTSEQVGVIAQEILEVLPHAVKPAPFDTDYDENKIQYSKSGNNYLTVQYERLVPLLIEAIKEQQKQLDELSKIIKQQNNT